MTRSFFFSPLIARKIIAATMVLGITSLRVPAQSRVDAALDFKAHPQVFSLVLCWDADRENPVVTEINLDAVEKNRNQFANDEVKHQDGWTVFRATDASGFKRYRLMEANNNHFKVEYQENGGGTLTTSAIIEFSVLKRDIKKNEKSTTIRVLRVDSCTVK